MSEDTKAQSLANLQPPPIPAPPSYIATLALNPEEVLSHALEDVAQHSAVNESQFYIPLNQRQNPGPKVLHQQLIDVWENLPLYGQVTVNSANITRTEDVIEAFFQVIAQGKTEVVQQFLDSNLLDANTPHVGEEASLTPLLCAIQHSHHEIVALLLSHGARVDDFGVCRPVSIENSQMRAREGGTLWTSEEAKQWASEAAVRTPLQLAAQLGNLDLVKLLHEEYHANDSVVAPDGQLALRLAKGNGHKAVVSYLPARRGGGYRRWKTKHHKFMKGMRKSVDVLVEAGTFVFWKIPKWFVKCFATGVENVTTYLWKNKHKFPGWCWQAIKELWEFILKTPEHVRKLLIACWECSVHLVTKTIPNAAKLFWKFSKNVAKEIANAFVWIVNRIASFLHTLYHAILSAFKALTWANVRAGFLDLVRAIFISIPRAFYRAIKKTIPAAWKGIRLFAKALHILFWGSIYVVVHIVKFLATHLWKIISAMGGSTATAGKEVYVWFNPKG